MTAAVGSGAELVVFWIIGSLMVVAALALLFARKPVHAAIGLIFVMLGMAFMYTMLEAPFLGVAQVVVYTGAIMVLFVFVLMLVGVDASDSAVETIVGQRWIAYLLGAGLLAVLAGVIVTANIPEAEGLAAANAGTNPVAVAHHIFGTTVFTLELVGVLLIIAALCAITLTHREPLLRKRDQRATVELRQRAYAAGEGSGVLTPMPAPGVYAQHNAADVPALDPAGQPIDISVPRVLRIRGQELSPTLVEGHVAEIAEGHYIGTDLDGAPQVSAAEAATLARENEIVTAAVVETEAARAQGVDSAQVDEALTTELLSGDDSGTDSQKGEGA